MSIDDPQIDTSSAKPVEIPVPIKGSRGELGVATPGLIVRQKWTTANSGMSLKQFARQLAKDGDKAAKDWFANKRGAKNQSRSDKSLQRIAAENSATKLAKHKTGGKK